MDNSGATTDAAGAPPAAPPSQQPNPAAAAMPAMHPALAAINPAMPNLQQQQNTAAAAAAAAQFQGFPRPPGAPTPGLQQPFFFPGMQQLAAVGMVPPRPRPRPSKASAAGGAKKQCNCKNSRCLKLYCECFASGRYCDGCNCNNCCNNHANEEKRQAAVEAILDRNPNAFRPKIAGSAAADEIVGPMAVPLSAPATRHSKGCNCKKSGCLKKYCECFQAGIVCSENCKCVDCKNFDGSAQRAAILSQTARVPRGGTGGSSLLPAGMGHSMAGLPGLRPGSAAGLFPKSEGGGGSGAGLSTPQRQAAAKDALREVITPEVVEKLATLLTIISNEEAQRRAMAAATAAAAAGADGEAAMAAAVAASSAMMATAGSSRMGNTGKRLELYEEQERLVLTEFRDTLRTITRVVAEKVDKRASVAVAKHSAMAQALAAQQAHQAQAQALRGATAAANAAGVAGMQAVYAMRGGQPQLMLLPQQIVAQQMAAQQAQMQAAMAQQQQQQQQQMQQQQVQQQQIQQVQQVQQPDGPGAM